MPPTGIGEMNIHDNERQPRRALTSTRIELSPKLSMQIYQRQWAVIVAPGSHL